jgi:hypothetical protein
MGGTATGSTHADGLGSTTALADGTGAVTDSDRYDAFGKLLSHSAPSAQPYRYTAETRNP